MAIIKLAKIRFQSEPNLDLKANTESGIVQFSELLRKYNGSWKSFQTPRNTKMTAVVIEGTSNGRIIRRKSPIPWEPSTKADSSTSFGIVLTNPVIISMMKGE